MAEDEDDSAPSPFADQSGEDLPLVELETILNRPPSRRKRLAARVGLVLAAAAAVLVLLRGSILPPWPTAPPSPDPNTLLVLSNVNYGTVSINGKKQPWPLPLLMPMRGKTSAADITLSAPPFHAISCHVHLDAVALSITVSAADRNCSALPVSSVVPLARSGVVHTPIFRLFLFLTPGDLPAGQQDQVTALLTQALTTRQEVTVPAFSYFATGFHAPTITSQHASAPLRATASLALAISAEHLAASSCVRFICAQPIEPVTVVPASGQQWSVRVGVTLRWSFSDPSGAVVSDVPYWGDASSDPVENTMSLFLTRTAAGDWTISQNAPVAHVSFQVQATFCSVGVIILQQTLTSDASASIVTRNDRGVQGCELQAFVNGTSQGTFLWRFGVLLAADAKAHATYPPLPVAPPEEIAAVERI
ncbi:MAG TPA: hypothetical protein VKT82_10330 [Ktedonobacterales bacterium]|nr:hypothetical protein [Ktedonobacterales bacterium]